MNETLLELFEDWQINSTSSPSSESTSSSPLIPFIEIIGAQQLTSLSRIIDSASQSWNIYSSSIYPQDGVDSSQSSPLSLATITSSSSPPPTPSSPTSPSSSPPNTSTSVPSPHYGLPQFLIKNRILPFANSSSLVYPSYHVAPSVTTPSDTNDSSLDFMESFSLEPEKWLRHSPLISSFYCLAYTLVFILGIVGNSFVVAVVFRSPRMRTVTNYFIVNLALADILVLLFCLPFTLIGNLFIPWILGLFICKAVSYLQGVAVSASINTLVAVSIDRFLAICYPLKCQMSRKCARRVIIVIWLFSLVIAFPWALYFTLSPVQENSDWMLCTESWPDEWSEIVYFVAANLCLCYLIPLIIITACYIAIWLKVWRRNIPGETDRDTGKNLNSQMDLVMQRSKLKVAKMMVVVVVIFLISWLPLYILAARFKLGGPLTNFEEKFLLDIIPWATWLGVSNSCINPILYAFFNKKYRKGFAAIVKSRKCCGAVRYEASISTYYNRNTTQRSNRLTTRLDTQCEYINSIAAL
ncbi:neuropeptide SIFamide receptor-like [Brevipalpus obovatus]|uniref:neuropeptide SIFamide receptor-like n=1 Tax=Brevipalpus obovatus TaxID=246614 RepID=UPI003D9F5457